jgi:hypothetical protein
MITTMLSTGWMIAHHLDESFYFSRRRHGLGIARNLRIDPGTMKAHPGVIEAHSESHPGDIEAHPGVIGVHAGAKEAHPGLMKGSP